MDVAAGANNPGRHDPQLPAPSEDVSGRRMDVAAIVGGLAVLAVGMVVVRNGTVSGVEEALFRAVNDLPDWLYRVAWPFQQLGALVVGPVVALVALVLRKYRLAIAAMAVTVLKLVGERVVKALVSRERPGTSIGPDIELRGDVHVSGESFVSGHAVLVAGLAGVVSPYLPGRWKLVPWVLVGAVMVGRVYVGAHNPLDVICGAALGIAIAGAVNLATGVRRRTSSPAPATTARRTRRSPRTSGGPAGAARARAVAVTAAVGAIGAVGLVACAAASHDALAPSPLADDVITVERAFSLGPREFVGPALADGLVELVPEYAGTAAEFHSLGAAEPTDDVEVTHRELERAVAGRPITVLAAAESITPLVRTEVVDRWGDDVVSVIDAVSSGLTTEVVRELDRRVAAHPDETVSAIVAAWAAEVS